MFRLNCLVKGLFMVKNLWNDEAGFTVALELILVAVILVIGLVTGLSAVRNAVLTELDELADAILAINDSYSFGGSTSACASTGCTTFTDTPGTSDITLCTCAATPAP